MIGVRANKAIEKFLIFQNVVLSNIYLHSLYLHKKDSKINTETIKLVCIPFFYTLYLFASNSDVGINFS